jgi:hypothetical protein
VYVPATYRAEQPAPLAVMFHGAGGTAQHGMALLQSLADAAGMILLAPWSRRQTWDVIQGEYGPDIRFIDQALTQTFERYAIDSAHIAVGGFSDGASYALSVGIMNGDLLPMLLRSHQALLRRLSSKDRHGCLSRMACTTTCSRLSAAAVASCRRCNRRATTCCIKSLMGHTRFHPRLLKPQWSGSRLSRKCWQAPHDIERTRLGCYDAAFDQE